ncbi:MAG: hypothetical protein WC087_03830 [Candidatus Paceibacterota bacterium]
MHTQNALDWSNTVSRIADDVAKHWKNNTKQPILQTYYSVVNKNYSQFADDEEMRSAVMSNLSRRANQKRRSRQTFFNSKKRFREWLNEPSQIKDAITAANERHDYLLVDP